MNSPPVTSLPPETTDPAGGGARVRPVRLASWAGGDARLIDVYRAGAGTDPDPAEWLTLMRAEHPRRSLAVVYDSVAADDVTGAANGNGWRDRLCTVVACPGGGSDRFDAGENQTSLSELRSWVGEVLRRRNDRVADVAGPAVADTVLVVDELVSNAREHAAGGSTVDLCVDGGSAVVVVSDPHPESMPALGYPPPSQPSGRGLLVVDALSLRWGVVIGPASKSVWAEVAWPV